MSAFESSGSPSSAEHSNRHELVTRYQRLRNVRMHLCSKLVSRLPIDAMDEGAKKLGMLRGDTFVFGTEDESSVLMDYCIYNVIRRGRNAVEQYLCDCPPDPDSDEMTNLRAMQQATYALVVVEDIEPGVGCHIRNMFTDETRLLLDVGLSATAQRRGIMAARLLDYGEFVTTSGAGLPLGILPDDQMAEWQRRLPASMGEADYDPAPLIRECLRRGASSKIVYAEPGGRRASAAEGIRRPGEPPAKRHQAAATREDRKPAPNRRCRCGSGKMFKNCCGKS